MAPMGEDRRGWRFEKRIGLDTILAVAVILGSFAAFLSTASEWKGKTDSRLEGLEKTDARMAQDQKDQKADLTVRLDRLETKLDAALAKGRK